MLSAAATAVVAAGASPPTRHERTLRNCARDPSDFARGAEAGCVFDKDSFRDLAREQRCEATKQT
jgi:hypothetical protein